MRSIISAWYGHQPFGTEGLERSILRQLGWMEYYDVLHPRGRKRPSVEQGEYIDTVAHLVCFLLRRTRESASHDYRTLANHLFPTTTPVGENRNRVITFNYDDLLDEHLLGARRYSPKRLYFDRMDLDYSARRSERYSNPLMLKLHGSVNWRCPSTELRNIIEAARSHAPIPPITRVDLARTGSPSTDDRLSPLIIPPLQAKPLSGIDLFCYLWRRAAEYLSTARKIVICGYSLPDADGFARSVFERASFSRLESVTVVDPAAAVLERWRGILRTSRSVRWEWAQDFNEHVSSL